MMAPTSTDTDEARSPQPTSAANDKEENDTPPHPTASAYADGDRTGDDGNNDTNGGNQDCHDSSQLPVEYQLDEVDLTNPDMDPLEYAFRRTVPIPKAYFWDTASESNDFHRDLPLRVKVWHNAIHFLGRCLRAAEAGGEVVATFLGVNDGPFDYVTERMTEEEMARSREIVERREEERAEAERRREGVV